MSCLLFCQGTVLQIEDNKFDTFALKDFEITLAKCYAKDLVCSFVRLNT